MKKLAAALLSIALLLTAGCSQTTNKQTGSIIARHAEDEEGLYYGKPGDTMRNVFFDFIVEEAVLMDSFGGYTAKEGMRLLCVNIKETNTFGEALPMVDQDFALTWQSTEELFFPLTQLEDHSVMPEEYELAKDQSATYKLVFEVPAQEAEFLLIYLEEFDNEETGDLFVVTLTPDLE